MDDCCVNTKKKMSLMKKKKGVERKNEKHQGPDSCYMVDQLLEYEQDKREEMQNTSKRIQERDDEILEMENEIRDIHRKQQMRKRTEGQLEEVNKLKENINRLSRENREAIQNLLFFPYALDLESKDSEEEDDVNFRKNTLRASFVNLKSCPRAAGPFNNKLDNEDAQRSRSNSGSRGPINLDKMMNYKRMFAGLKQDRKDSGEIVNYDFKVEDFGIDSSVVEETSPEILQYEEDNADALELLGSLEFNTKHLLRKEMKLKGYFETLCSLTDQYKRFYVLIETLKHKVRILNIISKTKLDMPHDVRDKLWKHSEKLVGKIDTLERTYRTLFETAGLEEIETVILLPEQVRPYEKCYRLIETTELKKYIHLLARHTQLIKTLMDEKQKQSV